MNKEISNKENFFEYYFRFLTLLFWPIICYKWIFIQNYKIEYVLCLIYSILGIAFIVLSFGKYILKKDLESVYFCYRIITITSYILTLTSFLLFPTNITLLYSKLLSIVIYFYFSCNVVYKLKNEEGVVGIISSLLLFSIAVCY